MRAVVVYHGYYGCESGCCGHRVELGNESRWRFEHPCGQDPLEFARELVSDAYGEEHVADLDWENCLVVDD